MLKKRPFAFVLMPFSPAFDDVYKLAIQAAALEADITAERVDEQKFSGTILERVYRQIETADFIIADMTGQNANVFYEVGYAHAHRKLCTLLTQDVADIPFDLKQHRHVVYGGSLATLKTSLMAEFSWLKSEIALIEKPVSVELKNSWASLDENHGGFGKVSTHLDFILTSKANRKSPDIEAIYLITSSKWLFRQGDEICPHLGDEGNKGRVRHFLKAPVSRLSTGAWAQIKVVGSGLVYPEEGETQIKNEFRFQGTCWVEIVTSEGTYTTEIPLDLNTDDVPF